MVPPHDESLSRDERLFPLADARRLALHILAETERRLQDDRAAEARPLCERDDGSHEGAPDAA